MNKMTRALSLCVLMLLSLQSHRAFAALDVFVSIPPQKWLCDRLGGELVTTHVLVGKGQDPHTFEPTPRQITTLFQSQLYFSLDLEFEEQVVGKIQKGATELRVVDTATGVQKDGDNHKGNNGYHDEDQHKGSHGHHDGDPHIWLSPLNLKKMAIIMTEALILSDYGNMERYQKNLKDLNDELDQLHETIGKRLQPYEGASIYVFHPSFGHFTKTYALHQVSVEVEGKSPRPKQLAAFIKKARRDGVKVIFAQPQFDIRSGLTVAKAIHGEVVLLDALAEDVAANLQEISEKIHKALMHKNL